MKASMRKEHDVIMAWSVDRLGRSLKHLLSFLEDINAVRGHAIFPTLEHRIFPTLLTEEGHSSVDWRWDEYLPVAVLV